MHNEATKGTKTNGEMVSIRMRRLTSDDVDRFDDAEANRMIAVRGDALDVFEREVPEPFHLWEALLP